jgi:hypothetical protein
MTTNYDNIDRNPCGWFQPAGLMEIESGNPPSARPRRKEREKKKDKKKKKPKRKKKIAKQDLSDNLAYPLGQLLIICIWRNSPARAALPTSKPRATLFGFFQMFIFRHVPTLSYKRITPT